MHMHSEHLPLPLIRLFHAIFASRHILRNIFTHIFFLKTKFKILISVLSEKIFNLEVSMKTVCKIPYVVLFKKLRENCTTKGGGGTLSSWWYLSPKLQWR